MHFLFISDYRESPSAVPLANGMHGNVIKLNNLMFYVPENKAAAYFPVSKNHVLTEIMLELLYIFMKRSPCQSTGHILNTKALCNSERSLKAQCLILKIHDIFDPGSTLKRS